MSGEKILYFTPTLSEPDYGWITWESSAPLPVKDRPDSIFLLLTLDLIPASYTNIRKLLTTCSPGCLIYLSYFYKSKVGNFYDIDFHLFHILLLTKV